MRGRGLVARGVIRAQAAAPLYSNVYAALVAIINVKFPQIGRLTAKRLIVKFRRAFHRNDKVSIWVSPQCMMYKLETIKDKLGHWELVHNMF